MKDYCIMSEASEGVEWGGRLTYQIFAVLYF